MPSFELGADLPANVVALRRALGSAVRELSRGDLAKLITQEHPDSRPLNSTTVGRWETGESEPDLYSVRIMARLAGIGIEQFAFGSGTTHIRRIAEPAPGSTPPVQPAAVKPITTAGKSHKKKGGAR